jgi:hypothetical protein
MARSQRCRVGLERSRQDGRRFTAKLGPACDGTQPSRRFRYAAADVSPNVVAMRVG